MSDEYSMIFILDPGDCPLSAWDVTDIYGTSIGTMSNVRDRDNNIIPGVFKWTSGNYGSDTLSIIVKVKGPTWDEITTKPAGMAGLVNEELTRGDESTGGLLPRWYSLAPYQPMFYNTYNTLTLDRANIDHVYHNTFYPTWVPSRVNDKSRALLFAPGFQLFDLGEIQSVTKRYHANTTVLPIVCYGYRRSFAMDLGTSMSVTLKYIRVQPKDWVAADDASGDSTRWSNEKWINHLRSLMDRWQMKTNGQVLYLLNPSNTQSRLPTTAMKEIYGANCYIASAPINYADMGPHAISSNIELQMGTLYPKKETPPMVAVQFRLAGDDASMWEGHTQGGYTYDYVKVMSFPQGGVVKLPTYYPWESSFVEPVSGEDYLFYIKCWSSTPIDAQGGITPYYPGDLVNVDDIEEDEHNIKTLYAVADSRPLSEENYFVYGGEGGTTTDLEGSFTVAPSTPGSAANISIVLVGGGGGGASGYKVSRIYEEYLNFRLENARGTLIAGGAGGSAGVRMTRSISTYETKTFEFCLGGGGGRGMGKSFDVEYDGAAEDTEIEYGNPGYSGRRSWLKTDSIEILAADGGGGGLTPTKEIVEGGYYIAQSKVVGNGGNGGFIENNYQEVVPSPQPGYYFYTVTRGDAANGGGINGGVRGGNTTINRWYTKPPLGIPYTYSVVTTGGGGGGSVAERDGSANPSGGKGGKASSSPYSGGAEGGHGKYGGGGGGGAAICNLHGPDDPSDCRTTNGGIGGRGYIYVLVENGIITHKSWEE